jgi:cytochrome c oxidase assembly protein subunit 11
MEASLKTPTPQGDDDRLSERRSDNRDTMRKLVVITALMFGFGFALVPFYKKICEVTGVNNLVKADDAPVNTQVDTARTVNIEFDANTNHLAWTFKPLTNAISIHPGELTTVMYRVTNTKDYAVTGQAIPSYAPKQAAGYFKKLECFCFTQQTLGPGESKEFPVVFVIDPAVHKDISNIVLSYTFFEIAGKGKPQS